MDDSNIFDKIHEVDLKSTMETSYIDYAMSVIVSRALPDVRDGLKPVQRRILYSMIELNNGPDKPHRKCARIVGDTMGKYHPHGDSSIYGALVNLAQEWSTRYPLVDGHGNFGSVDGDGAAAMRYTEARLSKISMEMMADINKDTVDFTPNFDETEKEPTVMPARFPGLLVNGTQGIAVGMATNIPPHNLRETINGVIKIIDNQVEEDRDTSIEELMQVIKGPDFPTGATILGTREIEKAYRTGRGKIKVRAVTNIEPMNNGKQRIVVTELPYMVNKARLIEKIAELVKTKRIDGITELRDESDRQGMRICIETRKDVNVNVLLNQLYKHTQLQDTFGVIMLALVDNQPKVLNLRQMLGHYLDHQKDVVTRRTRYELNKAEERSHILEGLLIALDHIDEVIKIIRESKNVSEAKANLMERFGLSEAQSQAIVDMRLRALTGLEREKLQSEYDELQKRIGELKAILADEKLLLGVIREEIALTRDKYGDDRRTAIEFDLDDLSDEALIPEKDTVITYSKLGYIKRMTLDNFHTQNRGGKGIKGLNMIDEDGIDKILMNNSHDYILFFTNQGRVYRMKGYEIPEASRTARGVNIINLLPLQPGEKVASILPLHELMEGKYLVMATKKGIVKKTDFSEYSNIRKSGLLAINMREDDELIESRLANDEDDLILVSRDGMSIRFNLGGLRELGRVSMGVIGMKLTGDDEVIGMQVTSEGEDLLLVSEYGMGKRTSIEEFTRQNRGGKGLKCYRLTDKTGKLVSAKIVNDNEDLMIINSEGIMIRIRIEAISRIGRNTSGVKLINIDAANNSRVMSVAKIYHVEGMDDDEDYAEVEGLVEEETADVASGEGIEAVEAVASSEALESVAEVSEGESIEAVETVAVSDKEAEASAINRLLQAAEADQEDDSEGKD